MKDNTGFFKKFMTSVYDINVFSKYAKEGIIKSIIYILIICTGVGIIKGGVLGYKLNRGLNIITQYLQGNGKNIYIKDGLLTLDSSIANVNSDIYIYSDKTINEDIDFKEIFYDSKIDLLILKDGIAFNNYGSIYALNYSDMFMGEDINSDRIISGANIFSVVIVTAIIVLNIFEELRDLVFNYLIIVTAVLLISMFMKMVVKYKALWSLVIYASTMPLIIVTILNLLKPNINFDLTFIGGTFTYVVLTLKHIKYEIIQNLSRRKI